MAVVRMMKKAELLVIRFERRKSFHGLPYQKSPKQPFLN
jgi:hypothetical protein